MTHASLEQRVAKLEAAVEELRDALRDHLPSSGKNMMKAIERYVGDEDLLAVFEEGRKLREADREKARKREAARLKRSQNK